MYKLVHKNKEWKGSFWEADEEYYFWDESICFKGESGLTLEAAYKKAEEYVGNQFVMGLRIQDEITGEIVKTYIDRK